MTDATPRTGRIRGLRNQHRWNQEQLAAAAGLAPSTVKKAEAGGTVLTSTLHKLAGALGVDTQELFTDAAVVPRLDAEPDHQALARLRAVVAPPLGLDGTPVIDASVDGPVDLAEINSATKQATVLYRADRYDDVAEKLPGIVARAHRAVAELDSDDAYRARARALHMAGRYLTQVRQLGDAQAALRASIVDAGRAGDRVLASVAIDGQGWALTRQGRLDECERLCVATAEEIEPRRMSIATPGELAMWGELLFRGAAAAVRNNRHDRADELMQMASAAAAALGREYEFWATFGPLTMSLKRAEFAMVAEKPDTVLDEVRHRPDRDRVGDVTQTNWQRHRLDVAHALVLTRDPEKATEIMMVVKQEAPEWLRRQTEAYQVVNDILATRPRRPSAGMVALAAHLGVAA